MASEGGRLPILLVPGFMSSGLRVAESAAYPDWKGERIWLAMDKLGLSAARAAATRGTTPYDEGSTCLPRRSKGSSASVGAGSDGESPSRRQRAKDMAKALFELREEDEDSEVDELTSGERQLKNKWVQHIMLKSPTEEMDGIRLEAIQGLEGIDFLTEGVLTQPLTSVFAPVTELLLGRGYQQGVDLDAAPYDWRFAPSVVQERDRYFDRLMAQIQRLNQHGTGVILLGHSMGNKMIAYFLNYVAAKHGRQWLDDHVHTWLAAGAPHLGAAQAARATLLGDRMGLEAFLEVQEGLIMAQSFSSSPWLVPLGLQADRLFYLRRQGALEICNLEANLPGRWISERNKVTVTLQVTWHTGESAQILRSSTATGFDGRAAAFDTARNFFRFGGPAELPKKAVIVAIVKEAGLPERRAPLLHLGARLNDAVKLVKEAAAGRGGMGVPRAWSQEVKISELLAAGKPDAEGFVDVKLRLKVEVAFSGLFQFGGHVSFKLRWRGFESLQADWLGAGQALAEVRQGLQASPVRHKSQPDAVYDRLAMVQAFHADSEEGPFKVWKDLYEGDPLYDETGTQDVPPVKRVVAVHGVNVPTEAFYALRINTERIDEAKRQPIFALDPDARLAMGSEGLTMSGGIAYEAPGAPRGPTSGDGVVNLASLERARDWEASLESLRIEHLDQVEHRGMLNDSRFHDVILDVAVENPVAATESEKI